MSTRINEVAMQKQIFAARNTVCKQGA